MPPSSVHPGQAVIDRYEQHLQWLFQGHQQMSRQWLQTQADTDPALAAWLSLRLRVALPPAQLQALPPHSRHQLSGWQLYYQGQYPQAAEQFALAWPLAQQHPDSISPMDVALGLGKVYTRTGDWSLARDWMLHSLALARAQQRLFAVTEGYGALGELFLRAGQAQAAQACMANAYQLLPPGSGQQAKQLNYLASALLRNGALLRAESLLMTALHMAAAQEDADSLWHALARLQFVRLQSSTTAAAGVDVMQGLDSYQPARKTPVACGFFHIGQALWLARQQQTGQAAQSLQQALQHLGPQLPLERIWAQRLYCALLGQPYTPDPALLQRWAPVLQLAPDTRPSVLDHTWQVLPLPAGNGFARLLQPLGTLDEEAQARTAFFI